MSNDQPSQIQSQLIGLVQTDGIVGEGPKETLFIGDRFSLGPTQDAGVVSGEECEHGPLSGWERGQFHADVFGIQGVGAPSVRRDGQQRRLLDRIKGRGPGELSVGSDPQLTVVDCQCCDRKSKGEPTDPFLAARVKEQDS